MIKSNQNHISKQCPSLVQIPKPLQHRKKVKDNRTRIKTIGYFENDPSDQVMRKTSKQSSKMMTQKNSSIKKFIKNVVNRGDMQLAGCDGQNIFDAFTFTLFGKNGFIDEIQNGEQRRLYVKKQPIQVPQPTGDAEDPVLSYSQLKQAQEFNKSLYINSEKSFEKKQIRSTDRLVNKQKPKVTSQNDYIVIQNQILKEENQKLKQLSHQRKNQIGILVKQILELKYQISNLIDDSENNQHFKLIQKSLNKGHDASSFLQKSVQIKKDRETRQSIAKDIFKKLKQVSYIQDSFLGEEIEAK